MNIPFNKPYMTGAELDYITEAYDLGQFSGDGQFTKKVHSFFNNYYSNAKNLLTHSCTAALEMAAMLIDIQPGDEIIMPSYTFVSTANAFALRGGRPVFIDIKLDTLNIDENLIENAITKKTKAIVPVHYAGLACNMNKIIHIARNNNLFVVEDAAQAIHSEHNGKLLGTFGDFGALSFHETKNIICGEGGLLLINNDKFCERAEIIREKGTNRSQFIRGSVDKYTWVDLGSSYLPGEINAAFLLAQLNNINSIIENRKELWNFYDKHFENLNIPKVALGMDSAIVSRPNFGTDRHNAHMYYLILDNMQNRNSLMDFLREKGVSSVFHYIPLHSSPGGIKYGKVGSDMENTERISKCLLRMPMFNSLSEEDILKIVGFVGEWLRRKRKV